MDEKTKKPKKKGFSAPVKTAELIDKEGQDAKNQKPLASKKTKAVVKSDKSKDSEKISHKEEKKKTQSTSHTKMSENLDKPMGTIKKSRASDDVDSGKDDLDSINSQDVDTWADSDAKEEADEDAYKSLPVVQKKAEKTKILPLKNAEKYEDLLKKKKYEEDSVPQKKKDDFLLLEKKKDKDEILTKKKKKKDDLLLQKKTESNDKLPEKELEKDSNFSDKKKDRDDNFAKEKIKKSDMSPQKRTEKNDILIQKKEKKKQKPLLNPKIKEGDDSTEKKEKKEKKAKTKTTKESAKPNKETKNETSDMEEEMGTWIQCINKDCNKWRYVADIEDPIYVPVIWQCKMNPDKEHNSCDAPEVEYDESEHIFTTFTIGSLVWAKMDGFPWWPGMIDSDPDYDIYFELLTEKSMVPFQYHVTFFDDHVTRAWIRTNCITPYIKGNEPKNKMSKGRNCYSKEVQKAITNANRAVDLSLQERVNTFGFAKRYTKKSKTHSLKATSNKIFTDKAKREVKWKYLSEDDSGDPEEDNEYLAVKTKSRGEKDMAKSQQTTDAKSEKKAPPKDDNDSDGDDTERTGDSIKSRKNAMLRNDDTRDDPENKGSPTLGKKKAESDNHTANGDKDLKNNKVQKGKKKSKGCSETDVKSNSKGADNNSVENVNDTSLKVDSSETKGKLSFDKANNNSHDDLAISKCVDAVNEKADTTKHKKKEKNKFSLKQSKLYDIQSDKSESKEKPEPKRNEASHGFIEPTLSSNVDSGDDDCHDENNISNKCETKSKSTSRPKDEESYDDKEPEKETEKKSQKGETKKRCQKIAEEDKNNKEDSETIVRRSKPKKQKKNDKKSKAENENKCTDAGSSNKEFNESSDILNKSTEKSNTENDEKKAPKNKAGKKNITEPGQDSDKENINPSDAEDECMPPHKKRSRQSSVENAQKKSASPSKMPDLKEKKDSIPVAKKPKLSLKGKNRKISDDSTEAEANKSKEDKKDKDKSTKENSTKKRKSFAAPTAVPKSSDREVPQIPSKKSKDRCYTSKETKLSEKSSTSNDQHVVPSMGMDSGEGAESDLELEDILPTFKEIKTSPKKTTKSVIRARDFDDEDDEEELDLAVNLHNVELKLPLNAFSGSDDSNSDKDSDDEAHLNSRRVIVKELETEKEILGRFAGTCAEHNSDSDPLELIED